MIWKNFAGGIVRSQSTEAGLEECGADSPALPRVSNTNLNR